MADDTYTKLFSSITASTVWGEPYATRVVWVTLLAMKDRDGDVHASVPGLARAANVTTDEARAALACFLAPDPDSRTREHDGRRIVEIDGGWHVLNHGKYRDTRSGEDTRERKRIWDQQHRPSGHARAKAKAAQSDDSPPKSDESPPGPTHADADADTEQGSRAKAARGARRNPVADYVALFPGVPEALLVEYAKVRRAKRLPITETAADAIKAEADKAGITLTLAIKTSVENSWAGFRASWYDRLLEEQRHAHNRGSAARPGAVERSHATLADRLDRAKRRYGDDDDTIEGECTEVAG